MAEKEEKIEFPLNLSAYIFAVISIIFGFINPIGGFVIGIIAFVQSKKDKTPLGKRAKMMAIIGIIISIVFIIIGLVSIYYAYQLGDLSGLQSLA